MSDPTTAPPLPDLPWTGTRELGVVSASGYAIAHVDPMYRFSAEDVHRISKFIAAAPETAERLREMVEAADDVVAVADAWKAIDWAVDDGEKLRIRYHDAMEVLRAAIARARGGA